MSLLTSFLTSLGTEQRECLHCDHKAILNLGPTIIPTQNRERSISQSLYFRDGTSEAQRGGTTCSWSNSWEMSVPRQWGSGGTWP